jgi:hypothetical protein
VRRADRIPAWRPAAASRRRRLDKELLIGDRRDRQALDAVAAVRTRWQWLLDNLDLPLPQAEARLPLLGIAADALRNRAADPTLFHRLQDYSLRVSWKSELKPQLEDIFDGLVYRPVLERIAAIHQEVLRSRLFVALHMHAGDGNVHTNIPVNSDHYEMLQTAYAVVERIMALARALDGVVSGEHGIGITKLEFLTEDEIRPFRDYKARGSTPKAVSTGQAAARRRPGQRLHALVLAARHRIADHGAVRDRQHLDDGQGLPALRQVQAGLLDARAARQPALLAAQQDPRHLAADRGLPLRGADPARRLAAGISTSSTTSPITARSATSASPLPGRHRFRQCLDQDAQSAARTGQARSSCRRKPRRWPS